MNPTKYKKKAILFVFASLLCFLPILGLCKDSLDELEDQLVKSTQRVSPAVVKITVKRPFLRMDNGLPSPRYYQRNNEENDENDESNREGFSTLTTFPYWEQFKEWGPRLREYIPRDFSISGPFNNSGSGMIVSPDGYILTAYHVVEHAREITVEVPTGKTYTGKLKGNDRSLDIALVKIDARNLPTVETGDSEKVLPGQWAIAIGYPSSEEDADTPSITVGHIGGVGRKIMGYQNLLQIDAQVAVGYGGGPVVNTRGEVIGLIIAKSGMVDSGIGYAVPINQIKSEMDRLRSGVVPSIKRGWLGVMITDVTNRMAERLGLKEACGALVTRVFRGSPADKGGVESRDVILTYNKKEVANSNQLRDYIRETPIGEKAVLQVFRKGNKITLTVRISEREEYTEISEKIVPNEDKKVSKNL